MSAGARARVVLARFYVLHHRPWRDTSRMLEVLTHEHGRLTLFARGVRGPRSQTASLLQPFRALLGSWSIRGDAGQLTQVESDPQQPAQGELPAAALLPAWYLNELLLQLTLRNEPQPEVFDLYRETIETLRGGNAVEPALRRFERRLLELQGYGIDFTRDARTGESLRTDTYYHFHPELGFVATASSSSSVFSGHALQAIAAERWEDVTVWEEARRLMRGMIDHALEGRELRTRAVARAVGQRSRREDAR